jgi:hypothetical protein
MAKMTATTKTVLGIVGSILVIGSAIWGLSQISAVKAQVDSTQDDRILTVEAKAESNKDEIGSMKVRAAEELATKKAIFDTLGRMEGAQKTMSQSFHSLSKDIGEIKIDLATTKTKVENLEKAD